MMTEKNGSPGPYKKISPGYMLLLLVSTFLFSILYHSVALLFNNNPMPLFDYIVFTSILVILITGGYQLFFWVQNNNYFFKIKCFATKLDDLIPFWPIWIWPYSFLYYIMIGMIAIQIGSIQEGMYLAFGGLILLLIQCICFLLLPCKVPDSYRDYEVNTLSKRYLNFVQQLDNGRNCFPSMHNSVAVYVGLFLVPSIGVWSYIFIATIAISTVLVKQHTIIDTVPGLVLGWGIFTLLENFIF
ncbi:MAG: phosphatase PAP2 family protein [Candidatus Neomarinimicrobiota bacterium]|nr:phosphatase PAP2 family protein [Candidatus Neomarinimicrobiota bacterium]MEC9475332.1 phosphatase PAP2 family protein [Candidatus Neomarinimicrobiota bacterium]|tara:strand:- start:1128 stop:1856 length:729 start_codon:yes stop_codon:yes gene_type:complete